MRRSKRKHNNRTRRKHLDKLARAKLARLTIAYRDIWYNEAIIKGIDPGNARGSFSSGISMPITGRMSAGTDLGSAAIGSRTITWEKYADIYLPDPYIPPPELAAVRIHIQALINAEKKRIRQEYLTTRTGKGMQDV